MTSDERAALRAELVELKKARLATLTGKSKTQLSHSDGGVNSVGWQPVDLLHKFDEMTACGWDVDRNEPLARHHMGPRPTSKSTGCRSRT